MLVMHKIKPLYMIPGSQELNGGFLNNRFFINPFSTRTYHVYGLRKFESFQVMSFIENDGISVRHTSIDVPHFVLHSDRHKKSQDRITTQCWKYSFCGLQS